MTSPVKCSKLQIAECQWSEMKNEEAGIWFEMLNIQQIRKKIDLFLSSKD